MHALPVAVDLEGKGLSTVPPEGDVDGLMHVDKGAVAAHQDPPPDRGTRGAQHDAEPIDVNGMLSRFQSGPNRAPAPLNRQPPLLIALLCDPTDAEPAVRCPFPDQPGST